jgi:hypothetical protein
MPERCKYYPSTLTKLLRGSFRRLQSNSESALRPNSLPIRQHQAQSILREKSVSACVLAQAGFRLSNVRASCLYLHRRSCDSEQCHAGHLTHTQIFN